MTTPLVVFADRLDVRALAEKTRQFASSVAAGEAAPAQYASRSVALHGFHGSAITTAVPCVVAATRLGCQVVSDHTERELMSETPLDAALSMALTVCGGVLLLRACDEKDAHAIAARAPVAAVVVLSSGSTDNTNLAIALADAEAVCRSADSAKSVVIFAEEDVANTAQCRLFYRCLQSLMGAAASVTLGDHRGHASPLMAASAAAAQQHSDTLLVVHYARFSAVRHSTIASLKNLRVLGETACSLSEFEPTAVEWRVYVVMALLDHVLSKTGGRAC